MLPAEPAELSLLIGCTAPGYTPEMRQHVTRLLDAPVNEDRLYELAKLHHLTMPLYRGLVRLNIYSPLRARLEAEMTEQAIEYEFIYPQQLALVLAELHAAGIQTLVLKGHALGQMIYQQPVLRPYSDFDILVLPDALEQAAAALRRLGYYPEAGPDFPPDYHLHHHHLAPYLHPEWLPVELHWRLVVPSDTLHVDMDSVWANAQPMQVNGVDTRALLPEHLLIYLALHAVSNHLFDIGLRVLVDVNEVIAACTLDWQRVVATSREWGCARQLYIVLRMAHEVYDTGVPETVLHDLCPQGVAPELLIYCLTNMLNTTVAGLKQSSGLAEAWQVPDPALRWRQIISRLFPPSAEVAAAYGLDAGDWRRWLVYPRWQAALIRRHLTNALRLVRADPVLLESARQEAIRRDLLEWVAQE